MYIHTCDPQARRALKKNQQLNCIFGNKTCLNAEGSGNARPDDICVSEKVGLFTKRCISVDVIDLFFCLFMWFCQKIWASMYLKYNRLTMQHMHVAVITDTTRHTRAVMLIKHPYKKHDAHQERER